MSASASPSSEDFSSGGSEKVEDLEQIPNPMDSEEALQGFAANQRGDQDGGVDGGNFKNNNNVDVDNKGGITATVSTREQVAGQSEGWYKRWCRWVPSSPFLLEQAEKKVLSYVKTPYEGRWINIGASSSPSKCKFSSLWSKAEENKIWTLVFNKGADGIPLVVVHGLCSGVGLWALNIDSLAENRPLYAIDLIGFGRSSRPYFSRDAAGAEDQHVEAIEGWRREIGLEKFVLLGHSMGGFISTSYALKYPQRVAHLVLADPWGMPQKPDQIQNLFPVPPSYKIKAVTTIGQYINPLAILRVAGPYGPGLLGRARPDLMSKFTALNKEENDEDDSVDGDDKNKSKSGTPSPIAEYIYHCNAGYPTGEEAFRTMMNFFGWAKNPMINRLPELEPKIPLTFLYGEKTWLRQIPQETLETRPHTKVYIVPGAGHHVYADNIDTFNSIVNKAGEIADKLFYKK